MVFRPISNHLHCKLALLPSSSADWCLPGRFLECCNILDSDEHSLTLYTLQSISVSPYLNHLFPSTNYFMQMTPPCIVSSSPAACQILLDMVQRWLDWSKLKAKVPKCHSLGLQASSGKRIDPGLSIAGERIAPVKDDAFKFLGCQ